MSESEIIRCLFTFCSSSCPSGGSSVWRNGLFITKFAVALVFVWFVERLFFLFCSLHVYFFLGRKTLKLSSNFFFFFRCNFNERCKESLKRVSFTSLKVCENHTRRKARWVHRLDVPKATREWSSVHPIDLHPLPHYPDISSPHLIPGPSKEQVIVRRGTGTRN